MYLREPNDQPQTHVFVIGCGRFPSLRVDGSANSAATVAGARAVARFLIDQADALIAPLGSVEVLLSDPINQPGHDLLGIGPFAHDPRANDLVSSATEANYRTAGDTWVGRCRPGDHMFFYMATHGVANSDATAVGVLEDVKSAPHRPWGQSINVTQLATALPVLGADGCWVFLDACQEVVPEILEQVNGVQSQPLISYSVTDLARRRTSSVALAGSRLGGTAWAPTDGNPPFFTQALIEALRGAGVEYFIGEGWVVTGLQILFNLDHIANAALNNAGLQTESLTQFNRRVKLLRVAEPMIPVVVRTAIENHMSIAVSVTASDGNGRTYAKVGNELAWRFRVEPDQAVYTAEAQFAGPQPAYQPASFIAAPPAQIVELTE
ncbi:caspase family protein [Rhizobium pusense]|uniref:caspase family protein n=1 Tax=Agrobacterium pusense TaxID=648995 RepID=UPI001FCDF86F|nr:caspase family protein [Agrobacterium pusense]